MLFVQMPLMVMTLPLIIALEAWLSRRWLSVSWKEAWKWASIANAASTVVGFPILWVGLVFVQMLVGGGRVPNLAEPWFSVYTVTVQAAWLLPFEDRLYWMIPTACTVLLLPAFFVTVFIERWIYQRAFGKNQESNGVTSATWKMHLVSYGFLAAAGLCLLGSSVASHKSQPGSAGSRGQPIGSETNQPSAAAGSHR